MWISKLSGLAFYLNGALGSGKYEDISVEDVKDAIWKSTIFEYLDERLGLDSGLDLLTPEDRKELNEEWLDFLVINERRKLCVDRNGLCLLVAFLLEGIQRRVSEVRHVVRMNFEGGKY